MKLHEVTRSYMKFHEVTYNEWCQWNRLKKLHEMNEVAKSCRKWLKLQEKLNVARVAQSCKSCSKLQDKTRGKQTNI